MGSFSFTCMFSNLTINYGDEVKFFVVVENPYLNNKDGGGINDCCYTNSAFYPRSFQIDAVYDDYGFVEQFKTNTIFFKEFEKSLQKDIFVTFDQLCSQRANCKIITNVEDKIANPEFKNTFFSVIRKDIWDMIVEKYNGYSYSKITSINLVKDKAREALVEANSKLNEKSKFKPIHVVDYDSIFSSYFNHGYAGSNPPFSYGINNMILNIAENFHNYSENEREGIINDLSEFYVFENTMHLSRRIWLPSYSCGPQFGEFNFEKNISKIIFDVANKIAEENKE